MGYYTWYSLRVVNEDKVSKERIVAASRALADITDIYSSNHIKDDSISPFDWISYDSMKWYDWEADMEKLGLMFPDLIFELYGEGEDRDDTWRYYIKGTKTDFGRAKIIYPPIPKWAV